MAGFKRNYVEIGWNVASRFLEACILLYIYVHCRAKVSGYRFISNHIKAYNFNNKSHKLLFLKSLQIR